MSKDFVVRSFSVPLEDHSIEKLRWNWSYATASQFLVSVDKIFVLRREDDRTKLSEWKCYKDKLRQARICTLNVPFTSPL